MHQNTNQGLVTGKDHSSASVSGQAAEHKHVADRVQQLSALGRPSEDAMQQTDGSFLLILDDNSTLRWTKRPDGTWRKPEHKRAGWVGELEQEKYVPGEGLQKPSRVMKHEPIRAPRQHGNDGGTRALAGALSKLSVKETPAPNNAAVKRAEREQAVAKSEGLEVPERVAVNISDRPFGMSPSKLHEKLGYVIVKVSDGKPAAAAGVRPGWRVATVSGTSCEGLELDDIQTLLKQAELPVLLEFDTLPGNGDFCIACQQVLVKDRFSRKMRTKPPDKRRCEICVDANGDPS